MIKRITIFILIVLLLLSACYSKDDNKTIPLLYNDKEKEIDTNLEAEDESKMTTIYTTKKVQPGTNTKLEAEDETKITTVSTTTKIQSDTMISKIDEPEFTTKKETSSQVHRSEKKTFSEISEVELDNIEKDFLFEVGGGSFDHSKIKIIGVEKVYNENNDNIGYKRSLNISFYFAVKESYVSFYPRKRLYRTLDEPMEYYNICNDVFINYDSYETMSYHLSGDALFKLCGLKYLQTGGIYYFSKTEGDIYYAGIKVLLYVSDEFIVPN